MSNLNILPSQVDISVVSQTDNVIEVTLTTAAGVAVDITLDAVKFTARDTPEGTAKIPTITNAAGSHSTPTTGKTRFTLSKTLLVLTDPAVAEAWHYEVRRVVAVSGAEIVYIAGKLTVRPGVGI